MSETAFTRLAGRVTMAYAAVFLCGVLVATFSTPGIVLAESGGIGGDFLAFYTAGDFARVGDALAAYDFEAFDAKAKEMAPLEHLGLMWQYPPTMFFVTAPFAVLPYKISYVLWCASGWAMLLWSLKKLGFSNRAFWLLGFSPLCVNVIDNGQISLATAALLFFAAYDPKKHWLVAGVAAGLLTIKPQLGLLLPIAFLAVGAWRTIAVAIIAATLLHAPALLVFGVEGWRAFFAAVARLNADVVGAGLHTPPTGMTTLFGQLRVLGVSSAFAVGAQYVLSLAVMANVAIAWRREVDPLGKAALVCAGAILVTPYAYAYEMTVLLLPAAYIARRSGGVFTPEGLFLIGAGVLTAAMPVTPLPFGLQMPFLICAVAFALTVMLAFRREAANMSAGLFKPAA